MNAILLKVFVDMEFILMTAASKIESQEDVGFFYRHTLNLLKKIFQPMNENLEGATSFGQFWEIFKEAALTDYLPAIVAALMPLVVMGVYIYYFLYESPWVK